MMSLRQSRINATASDLVLRNAGILGIFLYCRGVFVSAAFAFVLLLAHVYSLALALAYDIAQVVLVLIGLRAVL